MINLEKSNDKMFVCNSCMKENPYLISVTPNGNNGCSMYLCKECLENLISQYNKLGFALDICDIAENQVLNENIDENTKFNMRAGINLVRVKLCKNS